MRQKSAFRLTLTRNTLYNRFRRRKNGIIFLGEWLNGRVVVSKTIGCVFESRLPCQEERIIPFFLFGRGMDAYSTGKRKFLARLRVTRKRLISIKQTYYFAIPSEPSASPYESRSAPKNGLFRSFCFAGEWTRIRPASASSLRGCV